MLFRNLHTLEELKEASSLIDTHSYLLQEHYGNNLPTLITPRTQEYKKTPKINKDNDRINQIIKEFTNRFDN